MTDKIKILLSKFYSGTTSRFEEEELWDYFKNNTVPTEYLADQELFISLRSNKDLISDLEISSLIDNATITDGFVPSNKKGRRIRLLTTFAIAASLALIIGISLLFTQDRKDFLYTDTFDDPYIAMQETQRVLALFATKINIAQAELEPLEKINMTQMFVEPIRMMRNKLEYLEMIETINKPMEMPILRDIIKSDGVEYNKN